VQLRVPHGGALWPVMSALSGGFCCPACCSPLHLLCVAGGEITSTFDDPGSVKLGHCKVRGNPAGLWSGSQPAGEDRTVIHFALLEAARLKFLHSFHPQVIEEMMIGEDRMIHYCN